MKVYLLEVGAVLRGTSTTSLLIGTGAKTLVLASDTIGAPPGLSIAGAAVVLRYDGSNTMTGTVTSYDPATRTLVCNIASVTGSGTYAAWTATASTTLRYGSHGYNDPSATYYYAPRLTQPAWMRRTAFAPDRIGGAVEPGYGEAILANGDGRLDKLRRYGFTGQAFTLLVGEDSDAYGDFVTELSGTLDQALPQWSQILLRLKDRLEELRQPVQGTKYAGSGDFEGAAQDIKGKPKPLVFGKVFDALAVCVDTTRRIYQVHDGALQSIDAVYVAGLALSAGAAYADTATLLSSAPSSGQYRVYLAGGMFRLGSAPTGPVTCDPVEGANAAARTTAQILKKLAIRPNGIDSGDVNSSDVTALDTASNDEAGLYVAQEATILDCMNAIAPSAGAWFGFDRSNDLRMKQLAAAGGSPAATLKKLMLGATATGTTVDLISLERTLNQDKALSVPVWRVVVHYKKCWTLQESGFDATISETRKAFLAAEFREAKAEDSTIQALYANARELHVYTGLVDEADASAEATRLLALHGVLRDPLAARVRWTPAIAELVDLGSVVQLEIDRYDYDAGALFTVVDIERDAAKELATLGIWG